MSVKENIYQHLYCRISRLYHHRPTPRTTIQRIKSAILREIDLWLVRTLADFDAKHALKSCYIPPRPLTWNGLVDLYEIRERSRIDDGWDVEDGSHITS